MSTMNITIIIPALQLPSKKRSTESPQPTTPFPQINISPSPTPSLSMSSKSKSSCTPASMMSHRQHESHRQHRDTPYAQENYGQVRGHGHGHGQGQGVHGYSHSQSQSHSMSHNVTHNYSHGSSHSHSQGHNVVRGSRSGPPSIAAPPPSVAAYRNAILSRENSLNIDEYYEDYEDDCFIPLDESETPPPGEVETEEAAVPEISNHENESVNLENEPDRQELPTPTDEISAATTHTISSYSMHPDQNEMFCTLSEDDILILQGTDTTASTPSLKHSELLDNFVIDLTNTELLEAAETPITETEADTETENAVIEITDDGEVNEAVDDAVENIEAAESADNIESAEIIESTENIENSENPENVETTESTEETAENDESTEVVENTETENGENADCTETADNIETESTHENNDSSAETEAIVEKEYDETIQNSGNVEDIEIPIITAGYIQELEAAGYFENPDNAQTAETSETAETVTVENEDTENTEEGGETAENVESETVEATDENNESSETVETTQDPEEADNVENNEEENSADIVIIEAAGEPDVEVEGENETENIENVEDIGIIEAIENYITDNLGTLENIENVETGSIADVTEVPPEDLHTADIGEQLESAFHTEYVNTSTENDNDSANDNENDETEETAANSESENADICEICSYNMDSISLDTLPTGSNSSPETVIHVLRSGNMESDTEPVDADENTLDETEQPQESESAPQTPHTEERPLSTASCRSCSSQTNNEGRSSAASKLELKRQTPVEGEDNQMSASEDNAQPTSKKTPTPPLVRQKRRSSKMSSKSSKSKDSTPEPVPEVDESEALVEEVIPSTFNTLHCATPTIITTPASARRERTDPEFSQSQDESYNQNQNNNNQHYNTATTESIDYTDETADEELLNENIEVFPTKKRSARLKSVRKSQGSGQPKQRVFPNPRKPSNYPQRTNKVTLARQALAREKRRVYVEERIQSYIKNAQALNLPLLNISLPSSTSVPPTSIENFMRADISHEQNDTESQPQSEPQPQPQPQSPSKHPPQPQQSRSQRSLRNGPSKANSRTSRHHHQQENRTSSTTSTSHSLKQNTTETEVDENNEFTTVRCTSVATTTEKTTFQKEMPRNTPTPKLQELQAQKMEASHTLPPIVDPNNYYLNNPITISSIPPPPRNLAAIPVARVPSHHRRSSKAFQQQQQQQQQGLFNSSPMVPPMANGFQSINLPLMSMSMPPMSLSMQGLGPGAGPAAEISSSFQTESESVHHSIFALPSNVDEKDTSSQKSWKGVEHHGYFYSFRVRQSGPVQMMDKCVQTGANKLNPKSTPELLMNQNFNQNQNEILKQLQSQIPQAESYTLSFSQTQSTTNDEYVVTSSNVNTPLDQSLSATLGEHTVNGDSENLAANPGVQQGPPDERDKILREIADTVQFRHEAEIRRAELVQRANDLQQRVKEKRDKINRRHEFWHKKYIEESSLTRPLEGSCSSLRAELNTVHRRLLAHLEGRDLPLRLRDGPSKKANYKIMSARLQHEIKELQQKVKAAKLKLDSEIKLKEQADREVREMRNDLSHKKVVMSLARSQVSNLPTVHSRSYDSLVY